MIDPEIVSLLETEAYRINRPDFIADDPVQFPRRFDDLRDIEVASLTVAAISWGKRQMILRDADRMLALMEQQPYAFMMEKGYEEIDGSINIHRTFFGRHLQWYLRGLREVYLKHDSLDSFARSIGAGEDEAPAWKFAEELQKIVVAANNGDTCAQCLPTNLRNTALKRINMALRWLVRDDGIVDLGVWKSIPKSKLYLPLDVHVGNTGRALGLLDRKANDRKSTEILTGKMREICPEDPALMDFALFGIGITASKQYDLPSQ